MIQDMKEKFSSFTSAVVSSLIMAVYTALFSKK